MILSVDSLSDGYRLILVKSDRVTRSSETQTTEREIPMPTTTNASNRPHLSANLTLIKPVQAKDWLENHNPKNRPLTPSVIRKYTVAIKNNEWKMNGEPIIFDRDGNLVNGQHRLNAVVQADQPIWALTVRGVDPNVFDTFDIGKRRSAGDILGISGGFQDTEHLAASLGLIGSYFTHQIKGNRWEGISAGHIVTAMTNDPGVLQSLEFCKPWKRNRALSLPWANLIALHYLFTKASNRPKADAFVKGIMDGVDLHDDSPIFVVRQRFLKAKKLERAEKVIYLIRAWNSFMTNTALPVGRLRYHLGEEAPQIMKLDETPLELVA